MRQTSGSMICPSCGKLIGVSEERCPFCGTRNPSLFGYAPAIQRLVGNRLDFTSLITVTCIVLYVGALVLQPESIFDLRGFPFGFLSPGSRALYQLGMTGGIAWREGWWWTLFTAVYLHGSLLHILFNVLWIRQLAPPVMAMFGPARGFVIFTFAGVFGFLVSNFVSGSPSVGASGGIFGLFGALVVFGRRRGESMLTRHYLQWAVILFVLGFFMSHVNNWAHGGGFLGGWLAASVMPASDEKREPIAIQILALALLAVTAAGFVLSFAKVTGILIRGG